MLHLSVQITEEEQFQEQVQEQEQFQEQEQVQARGITDEGKEMEQKKTDSVQIPHTDEELETQTIPKDSYPNLKPLHAPLTFKPTIQSLNPTIPVLESGLH